MLEQKKIKRPVGDKCSSRRQNTLISVVVTLSWAHFIFDGGVGGMLFMLFLNLAFRFSFSENSLLLNDCFAVL